MSKIGFINEGEGSSRFDSLKGYFVNRYNENYPDNSRSPNYPRAKGRVYGYQNPILGDPGWGEIARWQTVKQSAIETIVDQMIEQFIRDRNWFSRTRCRESLWNMYRRMEWWVKQNIEPSNSEYQAALGFLRDCIEKVLDNGDRPEVARLIDFSQGLDASVTYNGGWIIDMGTLYINSEDSSSISTSQIYDAKGLIIFNIGTALEDNARVSFYIDGAEMWSYNHKGTETDLTFRDVIFPIGAGQHSFEWVVSGKGVVRFKYIKFIESNPTKEDDYLPDRPKPYDFHYALDYTNHFDGKTEERELFSTIGLEKVSDFTDLLRYVSSTEDIEWVQVKSVGGDESQGNENIYKLPLDRLPDTLSSKITFNWRFKKRGYIEFKYLIESGEKSSLSFFINNNKVGFWNKTDGWQTAKFHVSQGQTYKFDFIVHKEASMNIGLNAVYLKDIRCVETIPYDMAPAPMDYYKHHENIQGKWKIYSREGVMASYYRGFTDGDDDRERTVELEFFNECDGWVSFGYKLGTNIPDRQYVSNTVFQDDNTKGQECTTLKLLESRDSSITICPVYSDGWDIDRGYYTTQGDGETISYRISKDSDVDFSFKAVFANICPPLLIAGYNQDNVYTSFNGIADITAEGNWSKNGDCLLFHSGEDMGKSAWINIDTEAGGNLLLNFEGELGENEVLEIYNNGYIKTVLTSSILTNHKITVPLEQGSNSIELLISQYDYFGNERGFYRGNINLESHNDYDYLNNDLPHTRIQDDLSRGFIWQAPNGRKIEFSDIKGVLLGDGDWLAGGADGSVIGRFKTRIDNNHEFRIYLPFNNVAYLDRTELEDLLGSIDYQLLIYEDINDPDRWASLENIENFEFKGKWQWVNIFDRFGYPGYGQDGVLIIDEPETAGIGVHSIEIKNIKDIGIIDGRGVLSFQYGALFKNNDDFSVYAVANGIRTRIFHTNQSVTQLEGVNINNIDIPHDTDSILFEYVQRD